MAKKKGVIRFGVNDDEVLGAEIISVEHDLNGPSGGEDVLIELSNGHEILIYSDTQGKLCIESD